MRLLLTLATAALVAWAASDLDLELANGSWWERAHTIVERLATLPERALDAAASEAAAREPKAAVRETGTAVGERPESPPSAPPEPEPPPAPRQPAAGLVAEASSSDRALSPVPSDPAVAPAPGDAPADPAPAHRFVEPAPPFVGDARGPGATGPVAASALSRSNAPVALPNLDERGDLDAPPPPFQPSPLDPEVAEEIRLRLDRVMDLASGGRG